MKFRITHIRSVLVCIIALQSAGILPSEKDSVRASWDAYCHENDIFWSTAVTSKARIAIQKRKIEFEPTLSVIVPCYFKHARHLPTLLSFYEMQTRLPDEVIISLSDAQHVPHAILEELQQTLWAFPVTLITSQKRRSAGQNRNVACAYASGDILATQDADDIPHPQRLEIIHYFFSTYDIDHMMYEYRMIQEGDQSVPFQFYDQFDQLQFGAFKNFSNVQRAHIFTNGNVAIRRSVFEKIQWPSKPRGEDVLFNREVYEKFEHCIFVRAILHGYREFLSSAAQVQGKAEKIFIYGMRPTTKKHHKLKIVKLD